MVFQIMSDTALIFSELLKQIFSNKVSTSLYEKLLNLQLSTYPMTYSYSIYINYFAWLKVQKDTGNK